LKQKEGVFATAMDSVASNRSSTEALKYVLAKSHGQAEQGSCLVAHSCAARFVYLSASHFGFAHNLFPLI
jgi:hypothetical protein